jgi:hypothetical protein
MKESITKFDLEAAFKALDEIEMPKAGKVRANRPALTEIFSRKSKLDALMEEYYDIGSSEGLEDAKEAREAEVAQAKLARIEKIVDLDAESAEDLLTSYVGKFIMQCPQCMTLFYKNPEDVVASEEDPTTVNVNEVCQHCGNESGYSLVGKVGEADSEEAATEELPAEDELDLDIASDDAVEEAPEETSEEDLNFDDELEGLDLDSIEDDAETEEEKKEESFAAHTGEALVEDLGDDKDLDAKLDAHNEYIEYLRNTIAQEEAALEKTENAQVKDAIQRRIDAFKADLEAALPDAVKNDEAIAEEPAEETAEEPDDTEAPIEEPVAETDEVTESLTEALHEDTDAEVSDAEFEQLMNSSEFKKPISDTAVRAMLAMEAEENSKKEEGLDTIFNDVDELQEADLEHMISDSLIEMYGNVAGFRLKECTYKDNKFLVEGAIHFTSGNTRKTTYAFDEALIEADKITLRGLNEKLGNDKQFFIVGRAENKTLITESFKVAKN